MFTHWGVKFPTRFRHPLPSLLLVSTGFRLAYRSEFRPDMQASVSCNGWRENECHRLKRGMLSSIWCIRSVPEYRIQNMEMRMEMTIITFICWQSSINRWIPPFSETRKIQWMLTRIVLPAISFTPFKISPISSGKILRFTAISRKSTWNEHKF